MGGTLQSRGASLIAGLALALLVPGCGALPTQSLPIAVTAQPLAVLGQVINNVQVRDAASQSFRRVVAGMGLDAGSQLQTTAASQVRLDFPDGSFLRLAPLGDMTLDSGPTPDGASMLRARLVSGKLWVILSGGTLQLYSPAGVTTLHGYRATIEVIPDHDGQAGHNVLIVSCLEAECSVQTEAARQNLLNGEQLSVSADGSQSVRSKLASNALADFLAHNPEVVASPVPVTHSPALPTPVNHIGPSPSPLRAGATAPQPTQTPQPPTETSAPPSQAPTANPIPATSVSSGILGRHIVRGGETLFCIARAYGVLPDAIATANQLAAPGSISIGLALDIPAAQWPNPSPGPICQPQFISPYAPSGTGGATSTPDLSGVSDTPSPAATGEPTLQSLWSPPANLSQSGAASLPALSADAGGNYYAAWWDHFDGARFAVYVPGNGWSASAVVPVISGEMPSPANTLPTAPKSMRIFSGDGGVVHALWLDIADRLMYAQNARPAAGGAWSKASQVAAHVQVFEAQVKGSILNLAYIQNDLNGRLAPGVYYRRLPAGTGTWDAPRLLGASLYFRSLPNDQAHITLATRDTGEVDIGWDDPQSLVSQFDRSVDGGGSFVGPVNLADDDARIVGPVRHLRVLSVHGGMLRIWEQFDSCNLFQQQLNPADGTWSSPVRVLEQLSGCLSGAEAHTQPDGRLALWAQLTGGTSAQELVLWDGSSWSQSWTPGISFINEATNRPEALGCMHIDISGERVVALGCDARGDLWATTSKLNLADLLPALAKDWRPLVALSDPRLSASLPSATLGGGLVHALWSQDLPGNPDQQRLFYSRSNGQDWSAANDVIGQKPDGPANLPVILADSGGWLHAVWSGGQTGQIYYSRSHQRDGASASGWSPPRALPALQPAGGSPAMVRDPNGSLVVVYTLPLNENRGVYLTKSIDNGDNWTEPSLVFDATAAGWPAVQDMQLVADPGGRLHLLISRGPLPPAKTPIGVYYLRSEDGGRNWTAAQQVAGAGSGSPRLVATARGEIYRFWVQLSATQQPVWEQWSRDGGQSWSAASLVPGLHDISPGLGLASDGQGALFLVGIEARRDRSAALFYLRWDGRQWADRQTLPLGYIADSASGAVAMLLPAGRLAVFYRVTSATDPLGGPYVVGYTERVVAAADVPALPTLAATAAAAPTQTLASAPTLTPIPTLDLNGRQLSSELPSSKWTPILIIIVCMLVVTVVAVWQLTARPK